MVNKYNFGKKFVCIVLFLFILLLKPLFAYDPRYDIKYDSSSINLFWFIHTSDTHIGQTGKEDYNGELNWFLNTCINTIKPEIVVSTGDLTDADIKEYSRAFQLGPQQKDEWMLYESITITVNKDKFYDIPGNHDRYGDNTWGLPYESTGTYDSTDSTRYGYTRNSVLGKQNFGNTPAGQFFKVVSLPNGDNYLFIGTNTCEETTGIFSIFWGVSDKPELSQIERDYIKEKLDIFYTDPPVPQNKLSFIFGHSAIYRLTTFFQSPSEWVLNEIGERTVDRGGRGGPEFVSLLNKYNVSAYLFGHTHKNRDLYDQNTNHNLNSIRLINTASPTENDVYRLVTIDNNGISTRMFKIHKWPITMITSPLNYKSTGLANYSTLAINNEYAYQLRPNENNFIRAVAFDPISVQKLEYSYKKSISTDWSNWQVMAKVYETTDNIWQGSWNCKNFDAGEYQVIVKATSSNGESFDTVTVKITNQDCVLIYPNGGEFLKGEFLIKAQINEEILPRVELVEFFFSIDDKKTWQDAGSLFGPITDKNVQIPFDSKAYGIESANMWFKVRVWVAPLN